MDDGEITWAIAETEFPGCGPYWDIYQEQSGSVINFQLQIYNILAKKYLWIIDTDLKDSLARVRTRTGYSNPHNVLYTNYINQTMITPLEDQAVWYHTAYCFINYVKQPYWQKFPLNLNQPNPVDPFNRLLVEYQTKWLNINLTYLGKPPKI